MFRVPTRAHDNLAILHCDTRISAIGLRWLGLPNFSVSPGQKTPLLAGIRRDAAVDEVVADVLEAAAAGDWEKLQLLLHPYLHWNGSDGVTLRGRRNVLRFLSSEPRQLAPPERFELRDGQIYRWWSR